jgi:uncharacterized protein YggE
MFRKPAIAAIACIIFFSTARADSSGQQVMVNGTATVSMRAEVLRLTMTIIQQGETAEMAYQNAVRRAEGMITAFRQFGFGPDDYITQYVVERRPHPQERKRLVFLAAVGMSLVADDFSAGTQMLDVATKYGVRDFVTYFDITDRRSAYEKALRRALADARIKAEVLASESGVKLGPLMEFEELSEPPDDYTYPRPLLPAHWDDTDEGQIPPEGAGSVRMSPQPYKTKAKVRAAFSIEQ